MQSIPAQTMEQLQGNNANETAIAALTESAADNEGIHGKEETDKAIGEAYEEAAQRFDANDWIVFRYGTSEEARAYEDGGGQCFLDFEPGAAEHIASKVIERVLSRRLAGGTGSAAQRRAPALRRKAEGQIRASRNRGFWNLLPCRPEAPRPGRRRCRSRPWP
jgi:hypothetical protein